MASTFRLSDAHFHLDLFEDAVAVATEAQRAGVLTIAVTTAPAFYARCVQLASGNDLVRVAAGLHPELVAERAGELPALLELIGATRWIGEVGLDFTDARADVRSRQVAVFSSIVSRCAEIGGRVVSVHSRRAARETIDIIGAGFPGTIILHWYSGPAGLVDRAVGNGCYFSVNLPMLTSESGRRIIQRIPRERVLTETDGPFTRTGNQKAQPGDVIHACDALARLWKMQPDAVRRVLVENVGKALGELPEQ